MTRQTRPSDTAANGKGRNPGNGRFAAGNQFGRLPRFGQRVGELRSAILRGVSADDVEAIARKLAERAKAGDVQAARLVFDRLFGTPVAADVQERIEELEIVLSEREREAS